MSTTEDVATRSAEKEDLALSNILHRLAHLSGDDIFEVFSNIFALTVILVIVLTGIVLLSGSFPVLGKFGVGFLAGVDWNTTLGLESYGVLPYILGTLVTSGIAIGIGIPVSLGIAIFLAEMAPAVIKAPLSQIVEILAAVPSVIYGFWGLLVLRPSIVYYVEIPLTESFGTLSIFRGSHHGLDIFMRGLILAVMIIPTVSSISNDVMMAVPASQREAAYSIGATRWEVVRTGVLGYARSGIFGATILGLGRAVGETMAVTMIIGNIPALPTSFFQHGATMASVIANEFSEADPGSLHLSALIGIGLTLFLSALVINVFAQLMVWRVLKVRGGSVE